MKISVSTIVLNEAEYIENALSSCSFADEIIIVDGGSTDETVEKIISLNDKRIKIVKSQWENDFAKQRQISLKNCTGDWIIRIDADEVFSEEFEKNIRDYLQKTTVSAVTIRQCNLVGNIHFYSKTYDNFESSPRIFKNIPGLEWKNKIHEVITGIKGLLAQWDVYVVHYGFLNKKRYNSKAEFYSKINGSGFDKKENLIYRDYNINPRPERSYEKKKLIPKLEKYFSPPKKTKPSIAIIRGPNLNEWEMKNYEPLMGKYDITAYTTVNHNFSLDNIKIPVSKLPSHPESPIYLLGLEYELFDKDIIFTADITWLFSLQCAIAKSKFGNNLVVLEWENIPLIYEDNENISRNKKTVIRFADSFVSVTKRAADALKIEGAEEDRITTISMGIDTNFFSPDIQTRKKKREELSISENDILVLFVGRFVYEKGIFDIPHAAKLLIKELPELKEKLKFLMIGRGPEKEKISQIIKKLSLEDNFIIKAHSSYESMKEYYNSADIFILPSIPKENWKEQFGMAIVEAMSCGVPVISTLSGSIPEVVGEAGILIQPNDPQMLSATIKKMILEKGLRKQLSKLGRKRATDKFDCKIAANQFDRLFEDLLINSGKKYKETEKEDQSENKKVAIDIGYYSQKRNEILNLIPASAKTILDVGCGAGEMGSELVKCGKHVTGIERETSVAGLAKKRLSKVLEADISTITPGKLDNVFDCIIFGDVLEHLIYPEETISKLASCLNPDGCIIVSIPNIRNITILESLARGNWTYQDAGILDKTHLRFFTLNEIKLLLQRQGFLIDSIENNMMNIDEINNINYNAEGYASLKIGNLTLEKLKETDIKELFTIQFIIKASRIKEKFSTSKEIMSFNFGKIRELEEKGVFDGALQEYEKALKNNPSDLKLLEAIARCHTVLGNMKTAEEIYKKIEKNCDSVEFYFDIAEFFSANKDYESALKYFTKCKNKISNKDENKLYLNTMIGIGDCLIYLNRLSEGRDFYLSAQKIDPASEKPHIGLGASNLVEGNDKDAEWHFREVLSKNPKSIKALLGYGMTLLAGNKKENAIDVFCSVLDIDPDNKQGISLLVKSAIETGNKDLAVQYLIKYLALHPADLSMLFSLGGIYFSQGEMKESEKIMERIKIFDPAFDGVDELLIRIRKSFKDTDDLPSENRHISSAGY